MIGELEYMTTLMTKLFHFGSGLLAALLVLWIFRKTGFASWLQPSQDELEVINKKVRNGEKLELPDAIFSLSCVLKDSITLIGVILLVAWLTVSL